MNESHKSELYQALWCLIAAQSNVMEAKEGRIRLPYTKEEAIKHRTTVVEGIILLVDRFMREDVP